MPMMERASEALSSLLARWKKIVANGFRVLKPPFAGKNLLIRLAWNTYFANLLGQFQIVVGAMGDKEFSPPKVLMGAISMRKTVTMVLASLVGGLALPAIAAEKPVSFVCRYDPAPCADNAATPLGLTYATALRVLTGQHDEIEALRQAIAARPDDLGARLQLIASGGDEREAMVILTDLLAWNGKAHKVGDPLAAAITGLLSLRQIDDDDRANNIDVADHAKIVFADIEAFRGDSKAKDVDRSELMAGLAYRYAMFVMPPKLRERASAAAIASFQARLDRKPDDKARLDLTAQALSLGLHGDEALSRADRLIELRRKLAALMPDDEQVRQALVAAYAQRAYQARQRGQEDVVRQDVVTLRDLAEQDIKANRFNASAAYALHEVYQLEAAGLIKADPAKAGSVLVDGMTRLTALRTRDPVFGGQGAMLAWPLLDAIGSLVSTGKITDAKALENQALGVMPAGTALVQFQRKLAEIYKRSGGREEAANRYRLILASLRAKPVAMDTARLYFESLDALFEIGRADPAHFDVKDFVQLALNYLRAPGFDELTKAADGDKADANHRLLDRIADNLHDLAKQVENIGADEATIPLYAAEVSLRESLARDPSKRTRQIGDLGKAYRKLCKSLNDASHYREAEGPCSKAVDIRREEATKRSFAFDELKNYVWALRDLGDVQDSLDRNAEAMETYNEGQRVADILLKRFPRQSGSYRMAAIIATAMGNAGNAANTTPSARLAFHRKAEAANLAELKVLGPEDFDYDYLAISQLNIGDAYTDLGDRQNAVAAYEQALDANDKSLKVDPDDLEHLKRRSRITRMLAREQRALGRNKEAIASLRLQIEALEKLKDITGKADDGLFPAYWSIVGLLRQDGGDPKEIATFQAKAQALKE